MPDDDAYRAIIDELVRACREGQGQVRARWVMEGKWPPTEESEPREFVSQLSAYEREILASMLADAFAGGVHESLVVLHEAQAKPFDRGYEGSPFNDFVGRLQGKWQWPAAEARW